MSTPARAATSPLGAALVTMGVAAAWLAAEAAVSIATIPGVSLRELGARSVEIAPWHAAFFAGIASGVALVAALQPVSRAAAGWLAVGGGSAAFLAARVAEGLMRQSGPIAAASGALGAALAIGAAIALLAAATRLAAGSLRRAATLGVQAAWMLGFVVFLDRVGPEIGEGLPEPARWLGLFAAGELARLAIVAAGVALLSLRGTALRLSGLALVIGALVQSTRPAPAPPTPIAAPTAERPDVILVVLDTLRADHLGKRDAQGSLTPALDALGADAVAFPNAFAPSNWTRGSMPGVLASLPYAVTYSVASDSLDLVAEPLQRAGYHGYGISANPLISARLGWAQGFERFVDPDTMGDFLISHVLQLAGGVLPALGYQIGAISNSSYFRAASELRRRTARMLDEAPRPTFLYVQAMDPHGPYLPPHEFLPPDFEYGNVTSYYRFMRLRGQKQLASEAFRPALENFRQRYAASVRYLDSELGALFAKLREQGRYDEALIWVLADHGEAFGEHDWSGHTGLDLGPALLRVPLLLKLPKSWGIAPRIEATAVSTYSILPTTLALLDLPAPQNGFGEDFSELVRGTPQAGPRTLFADVWEHSVHHLYAAIRWPWKLVVERGPNPGVRGLYDLAADPAEDHSLAEQHPELVATLTAEIEAFRARVEKARGGAADGEVDAETKEMLRRLGYVQ